MELKGKVALVTGAGRNMGKAIALGLASEGANLVINYSSSKKGAEETKAEAEKLGVNAMAIKADISKIDQIQDMVKKAESQFGRIDILVNNSGVIFRAPLEELTEEIWDNTLDVNLKGLFFCSKIVSKGMRERKSGKIINISSLGGIKGWPSYMAYCASKAGVIMFTKCLALSLSPHIQVNSIAPGTISFPDELKEEAKENFIKRIPLKRLGEYEDIVKTVIFLCRDSNYITGQTILVDGGLALK